MLSSSHAQGASFPRLSFSPKCNSTLPQRERFFPLQNAKSPQILPFKLFFVSLPFFFFFSIIIIFFPKNLEFFPKWKSYSPAFGGNNRRIDAPARYHLIFNPIFSRKLSKCSGDHTLSDMGRTNESDTLFLFYMHTGWLTMYKFSHHVCMMGH